MDLNNIASQKINLPSGFNPFTFRGRTRVLGMWLWSIFLFLIPLIIILCIIGANSGKAGMLGLLIIPLLLIWPTAVRRLHDHGLSGNWLFFLSPVGIALMYIAYVLEKDDSVNPVVEKISKTGGIFSWLYAGVAWFFSSQIALFCLLFLCVGKKEDNMFGPSPYPPASK